ncbi:MAG: hypothetical protein JST83_10665 [Bacteroidetes bacterium]|nr:hypothetical protein [Bacteroidota bacterium]
MKTVITIFLMLFYQFCISQPPYGLLMSKDISHDLFNNNLYPDDTRDSKVMVIGGIRLDSAAERVITFEPFFKETLVDSFWSDFRHFQPSSDYSTISAFDSVHRSYLYVLRLMCTDSFKIYDEQKVILHQCNNGSDALLVCKIRSGHSAGYLRIFFRRTDHDHISLRTIDMLPFDYSPNTVLRNVSEGDLELIRQHKTDQLIGTIRQYCDSVNYRFIDRMAGRIEDIQLGPDPLFTWRLFMEKGEIWVTGIFQLAKGDKYLALSYKMLDKRFKPAYIELLK